MSTLNELERKIAELEAQKARLLDGERLRAVRRQREAQILAMVDTLLALVPEHDRTSCSDENPTNCVSYAGRLRCERCELLYARETGIVRFDVRLGLFATDLLGDDITMRLAGGEPRPQYKD